VLLESSQPDYKKKSWESWEASALHSATTSVLSAAHQYQGLFVEVDS
jgi:hypothetical protein